MKGSTSTGGCWRDRDKEYFAGLWSDVRDDLRQSLIVGIGLACLFLVTLLYLEASVIDAKIWQVTVVIVSGLMAALLSARSRRKAGAKKVVHHDFDPLSLGILCFSFALSLWVSQQTGGLPVLIIAIFVSLVSLVFFFGVFSRSMRSFMNTRAAPVVMPLTFFAFVLGFALGWLPALSQVSAVTRVVVIYFGFAWVIAMLVILFRDVKNELARILFLVFFVIAAVIRFSEHDIIGIIGGLIFVGIAVLLYLVATNRLHPYGEVSEK